METGKNDDSGKGKARRHHPHQIERLEAFYKDCTRPNKSQTAELASELELKPRQVKIWFQNKRNTLKAWKDRAGNTVLREENQRLQYENEAFLELLKNSICLACTLCVKETRKDNLQSLKLENTDLKEKHEKASNEMTTRTGRPIRDLLSMPPAFLEIFLKASAGNSLENESTGIENESTGMSNKDKEIITEHAHVAVDELMTLLVDSETLWERSPIYGAYFLHRENYSSKFPKSSHLNCSSSRIESSKETVTVPTAASDLFDMFMDTDRYTDLFPSIVREAKNIETLDTTSLGGGIFHLMHVRTHILSPLVDHREFFFFRYGYEAYPGTWLIVDASNDFFRKIEDNTTPTWCWKFPSGVMISSIGDGASLVTWIEHVEVNESLDHPLYRNLLSSPHGYGATRWLSTLERMCERSLYFESTHETASATYHGIEGALSVPEARKSFLTLTHRMIKDLCATLSLPVRSSLLEPTNGQVKVSVRTNISQPGQPFGDIVSLTTTIHLPLPFSDVFDFLRDPTTRHKWDVMLTRSPMKEMARLSTGAHPGNYVSFMQPSLYKEQNVMVVQENSIDQLGALIVYAIVNANIMAEIMKGEDTDIVPVLPCGFLISGDGAHNSGLRSDGASTSWGTGSRPTGTLLTLAFQMSSMNNHVDDANCLNGIVLSIVQNLKVQLGCSELD